MKTLSSVLVLILAGLVAACNAKAPVPDTPPTELEPEAASVLREMSDDLAAASTITFAQHVDRKRVRYDGQTVQEAFDDQVAVRRPDAFTIRRVGDGRDSYIHYDGTYVSFRNDAEKVWGRVPAPGTLDETIVYLGEALRLPASSADLFASDPYGAFVGPETVGRLVGVEQVGGRACRHLQFIDPVVDFEVWVAEGEPSYPCKIRLVYKLVEGSPESVAEFRDWQSGVELADGQFALEVPEGFRRIPVAVVRHDEDGSETEGEASEEAPAESGAAQ